MSSIHSLRLMEYIDRCRSLYRNAHIHSISYNGIYAAGHYFFNETEK